MPTWSIGASARIRDTFVHPMLALGSTLLWGIVEFIALQRSHRASRR